MTKYREILRLSSLGFSNRNIALSVPCSRNTVAKVLKCFLQVQIPEICRQKWRILHLRFGESCRLPGRIT